MQVYVDVESGIAPWRQVHDQLRRMIDSGTLGAGARLPPIRQLARDLGLATGTVARVYRALENAGVVRTARGAGTVVVEHTRPDTEQALRYAARDFVSYTRQLGADAESVVRAIRDAYAEEE